MKNLKGQLRLKAKKKGVGLTSSEQAMLIYLETERATPKSLALLELRLLLERLSPWYVVVGGDWNTAPPWAEVSIEDSSARKGREAVDEFAQELGLVEPLAARLKAKERRPVTWQA